MFTMALEANQLTQPELTVIFIAGFPVIGRVQSLRHLKAPVFSMAVPIRYSMGTVGLWLVKFGSINPIF